MPVTVGTACTSTTARRGSCALTGKDTDRLPGEQAARGISHEHVAVLRRPASSPAGSLRCPPPAARIS